LRKKAEEEERKRKMHEALFKKDKENTKLITAAV
jgi:hypothetical protein